MIADTVDNLSVAWAGLMANKMRSGLTMLGVIIGVAAVVSLLSIGEAARVSITDRIGSVGTNLLRVSPGAAGFGPVRGAQGSAASLTMADAEALADPRNVPDADIVAPEFSRNTQIVFGNFNINAQVAGVTAVYQDAFSQEVARGRYIETPDVERRALVAVLGYQAARDLFGDFDPLGQKVKVTIPGAAGGRVSLTVVGVLAEQGSAGFSNPDDALRVPISTAQTKIFDGRNALGEIVVTAINVFAPSEDRTDAVSGQIDDLLRRRHGLSLDDDPDFSVFNQADLLEMASGVAGTLTVFLGAIAGISLLVGGIGIMNIMLVSVTERTREIGIRKAVGARKADILAQFLLESIVLSLLGGLMGVVAGVIIARIVDTAGVMDAVVAPRAVLLAVGFSAAVGLFFGISPANRAAGLNPIEALRYE